MVKREKFKIKRKKGRVANISLVLFTLVLIITLITISYARWTATLTIEGTAIAKEPELPVEPVKPSTDSDRFSTNTSFQAGWLNREVFKVVEDTVEGNVITTKLANGSKTSFITPTMTATFTLTIQNNSGSTYTDGTVTYTKLLGDVRMYDVDFGYEDNKIVLHDVNYQFSTCHNNTPFIKKNRKYLSTHYLSKVC